MTAAASPAPASSAEYGHCEVESHGIRLVVKHADDRVLFADALVQHAGSNLSSIDGAMHLDGNIVTFGTEHPLGIGKVEYELVSWDAKRGAHVARRLHPRRGR